MRRRSEKSLVSSQEVFGAGYRKTMLSNVFQNSPIFRSVSPRFRCLRLMTTVYCSTLRTRDTFARSALDRLLFDIQYMDVVRMVMQPVDHDRGHIGPVVFKIPDVPVTILNQIERALIRAEIIIDANRMEPVPEAVVVDKHDRNASVFKSGEKPLISIMNREQRADNCLVIS